MTPVHKEKPEKLKNSSVLKTYQKLCLDWPELVPLLDSFRNRDYGTYMHSVAVHYTASQLAKDLSLRIKDFPTNEIELRSPFWMLHDIGKTAADIDMEVAHQTVFPQFPDIRSNYQKAKHWIHPQMSGNVIKLWSQTTSKETQPYAKKWAQLSYLHDEKLNPFLIGGRNGYLNYADKLSLFIFSISDTAMAMGLQRPNKNRVYPENEIRSALITKYLTESKLLALFPEQEPSQLRNYILVSVFTSIRDLRAQYKDTEWIKSSTQPHLEKTKLLDKLTLKSWNECEKFWDATMMRMDLVSVFANNFSQRKKN